MKAITDQPETQIPAIHYPLPSVLENLEDDEQLEHLAIKVLGRAAREAMGKGSMAYGNNRTAIQTTAREWLTSAEAEIYCEFVGYDLEKVRAWVAAGCPEPAIEPEKPKRPIGRPKEAFQKSFTNQT
jgi:hypothetical protein